MAKKKGGYPKGYPNELQDTDEKGIQRRASSRLMSSEQITTARRQKNQHRAMIGPEEDNHTTDNNFPKHPKKYPDEGLFKADVSRIWNDNTRREDQNRTMIGSEEDSNTTNNELPNCVVFEKMMS